MPCILCDPATPLEETMQALVDIVRQGKALYVGISKYPDDKAREAYSYLADRDVPCLLYQGKYNIFERSPETSGILSDAANNGVGFIAFSPLAQGLLSDRYMKGIPETSRVARGGYLKREEITTDVLNKIVALNEIAASRNQSLAQMALSWCLRDEKVTSVIVGASTVDQLKNNLEALKGSPFSHEELERINQISE